MPEWPREIPYIVSCPLCSKRNISRICRKCGQVVCMDCCTNKRPYIPVLENIPASKNYNPQEAHVTICNYCAKSPDVLYLEDDFLHDSIFVRKAARLSRHCIKKANAFFPVSSSRINYYCDYNKDFYETKEKARKYLKVAHNILREPELYTGKSVGSDNPLTNLENIVLHCLKYSIANCLEMAFFSYLLFHYAFCLGMIRIGDLRIYELPKKDHVFLVISPWGGEGPLPKKITSSDPGLQRSKAIVCDPWLKSLFFLKNYCRYIGRHSISEIWEPYRLNNHFKAGDNRISGYFRNQAPLSLLQAFDIPDMNDNRDQIVSNGVLELELLVSCCMRFYLKK
ncbi:MAG: hypothetical protein GY750_17240 [Lentisphaerae bacterium]|nr:hypothetical protein [Lentisphaerota bacterium]MCP4103143.1 hypothetical protein [Lentisphaerota bacterium]